MAEHSPTILRVSVALRLDSARSDCLVQKRCEYRHNYIFPYVFG